MVEATARRVLCALCGTPSLPGLLARAWTAKAAITAALRKIDSSWEPAHGACLRCVYAATREVLTGARRAELFRITPVPQAPGAFAALPIGVRVGADPGPRGRGVTMALLDAGFHPHRHLIEPRNRILTEVHLMGRRDSARMTRVGAQDVDDDEPHRWHGSMTSGVAAGNGLLSDGLYPGLASESNLVLVRVRGHGGRVGDTQITAGLHWVLTNYREFGIRIVSLSVGGDRPIPTLKSPVNRLIRRLVRRGIIVVAAAGNRAGAPMVPPATAPEALTVGGLDDRNMTDPRGWRPWASTHGRTVDGLTKPDILAPSVWVPAPILPGTKVAEEAALLLRLSDEKTRAAALKLLPARYQRWRTASKEALARGVRRRIRRLKLVDQHHQHVDGTSFAAPIVASCLAQILEVVPDLDPNDARVIIMRTAVRLDGIPESVQGAGVLRAGAAVAFARRLAVWRTAWPSPRRVQDGFVFLIARPGATSVRLVAEWNGFGEVEQRLHPVVPGVFRIGIPSPPPGEYAYAFLVDEDELVHDQENPRAVPDGLGGQLSVLRV